MEEERISKDAIFEVLSSGRRRLLLYHLYRRGGEAGLRALAEDAAAIEFGEPLEEDQIKRIYIAFYQTHVPKLESIGFVTYDPDEQYVTLEDKVVQIARVLPEDGGNRHPWPAYYLFVALVGLSLAAVSFAEIGVISEIATAPFVAIVLSLLLLLLSGFYYLERRRQRTDLSFLEEIVGD